MKKKIFLHISKKAISIFSEKKKVSQVKKNQTQILEAFKGIVIRRFSTFYNNLLFTQTTFVLHVQKRFYISHDHIVAPFLLFKDFDTFQVHFL